MCCQLQCTTSGDDLQLGMHERLQLGTHENFQPGHTPEIAARHACQDGARLANMWPLIFLPAYAMHTQVPCTHELLAKHQMAEVNLAPGVASGKRA